MTHHSDTPDLFGEVMPNGNGPQPDLRPFKIVGQIIASEHDAEGQIIGERVVGDVVLYESQFDELREKVEQAWPQVLGSNG